MSHPVAVLVELEYWADTAQRLHRLSSLPWFVFLDSCRAGGGRILGFTTPAANGNPMPVFDMPFAGASAVALNK